MALKYKTRRMTSPQGKPRVYFCCHPDDFKKYFEIISDEILTKQNCAIWYTDEIFVRDEEYLADLNQMQLFVMPVTMNLLCTENEALDTEFMFAIENHIPVLPLIQEGGLEELFNKKCGDLQFLDKNNPDTTAIRYDEKLQKYLESILFGDELAAKIRAAFDAYVFLSYRKKDRKYAQELMRLIHQNEFYRDIAIWYDEFLTPGENFNDSIKEALKKSNLFVLAVTPNLVNESNYIMSIEYPMAKQEGKPILPAELVPTNRELLSEKYEGIPSPADAHNEAELSEALLDSIKRMAIKKNDNSPEHNFFIGLAYLGGVDIEVNRERALELIVGAANRDLPEAMVKLISMYTDGVGVSQNQSEVKKWSKKLADYYFKYIFTKKGTIKSKKKIVELFSNYKDKYWTETIKYFLINADKNLSIDTINSLYNILMSLGISEYTLLFDTCKELTQYREQTQKILVNDILAKSVNGAYPPYGPLFWYIPEYELYEVLLLALDDLQNSSDFAKMLALARDVCWILGHKNTVEEVTRRIIGGNLYRIAKNNLTGVRNALCELFFTGKTDYTGGDDVYPRCFNVAEAKSFINTGCGVYGIMHSPFVDELHLFSHEAFNTLADEYVGIISCPYSISKIENTFIQKSHKKVCGLILGPTTNTKMEHISINHLHIRVVYIPENITEINNDWTQAYPSLEMSIGRHEKEKIYIWQDIVVPNDIENIPASMFGGCRSALTIHLHAKVKEIGWSVFSGCTNLVSIQIPSGVKKIGGFAFKNCIKLNSILIPNGVESIGQEAFENCQNLDFVDIPDSVSFIGVRAFANCINLCSVHLPCGITFINEGMFKNCINLRSIDVPLKVKEIMREAFAKCKLLSKIDLHDNIEAIGRNAFFCCKSLHTIRIPEKVTIIFDGTFAYCETLVSIEFNKALATIEHSAFSGCASLVSVDMPENISIISFGLFSECTSLESVNIPKSVKKIDRCAFYNCSNLTSVTFSKNLLSIEEDAFKGCEKLLQISLPETEYIAHNAFDKHTKVIYSDDPQPNDTMINISSDISEIASQEFENRKDINAVFIPNTIRKIGAYAFRHCSALSQVNVSDGVTKIGWGAFIGCIGITSITIPNTVSAVGKMAFQKCINLKNIILSERLSEIEAFTFEECTSLKTIRIPNNVREIGGFAFRSCTNLESVYMSDNLFSIADGAFKNCCSLKNIRIPKYVTKIKSGTFEGCINLTNISMSQNVQEIKESAFDGCAKLSCINMSDNIISIGKYAFRGCGSLSYVRLPHRIKLIEVGVFESCKNLNSVIIDGTVTKIERLAFHDCKSLISINLPNGLLQIGKNAFKGCSQLKKIEIPDSVRIIEDHAFEKCENLEDVIISRRFEGDIHRIFGEINPNIINCF